MGSGKSIVIFVIALVLNISCADKKSRIGQPTETEKAEIQAIGDRAAGTLLKTLQSELLSAIQEKGLARAIDVCRVRAISLTDSLADTIDRVEKIKRTSTKIRNPLNEADVYERNALDYYTSQSGKPPLHTDTYVQKLTDAQGTYYRYYKPLQIQPVCTACHGQVQSIAGEVAEQLKLNYPEDRATGYVIDEFRGVVSVTIR